MEEETYRGSILVPNAAENMEEMAAGLPDEISAAELQEIRKYTEENNRLLNQIEQHTMTMTIIMVISAICSAVSVVAALITIVG